MMARKGAKTSGKETMSGRPPRPGPLSSTIMTRFKCAGQQHDRHADGNLEQGQTAADGPRAAPSEAASAKGRYRGPSRHP